MLFFFYHFRLCDRWYISYFVFFSFQLKQKVNLHCHLENINQVDSVYLFLFVRLFVLLIVESVLIKKIVMCENHPGKCLCSYCSGSMSVIEKIEIWDWYYSSRYCQRYEQIQRGKSSQMSTISRKVQYNNG